MKTTQRRHDLDWLRVLAMLLIFFFHCARYFNDDGWHVKNFQTSFGMSVFVVIVAQFIMPLFFVLSAVSINFALNVRTPKEFLKERFKRLVIPLIFGILVIIAPLQVWIERVSQGVFTGSFLSFYPHYFKGFYAFGGNFAWMGLHLWYLEMLFLFSLITLPLFLYLRQDRLKDFRSDVAGFFEKTGTIFLFALPVFIMEIVVNMQPQGIGRRDFGGWSFMTHLVFFVQGYWLSVDSRFKEAIERQRIPALMLAVITAAAGYVLFTHGCPERGTLLSLIRSINSWSWLFAILGFGSRHLSFHNRILLYGNSAVLPFYILHQTIIVFFGFLIVDWKAEVMTKYLFLVITSFISIMLLYDIMIKRLKPLRFLFGLKPGPGPGPANVLFRERK